MDIIKLDHFQEILTEQLIDLKRITRQDAWGDLLA